jgi:hypothetical protein
MNSVIVKNTTPSSSHARSRRLVGVAAMMLGWCVATSWAQTAPTATPPAGAAPAPAEAPTDIGWPRTFELDGKQLTVHQPQVDSWKDFKELTFRCAISVKGVLAEERYGVAEIHADTLVDHASRMVAITPKSRTLRFANATEADAAALEAAVNAIHPPGVTIITLDRLLAYVDESARKVQRTSFVSLEPPDIYYSAEPAVLVIFIGKPRFKPVNPANPGLEFAINTNWDVLRDTARKQYFLLDGDGWITSSDPLSGAWTPATSLPFAADTFPADDNWAELRKHIPGAPLKAAPRVFVSSKPAELIVTDGPAVLDPIPNTNLSRVSNTDSVLFQNSSDGKFYFLAAGRWFRAGQLSGPWTAASATLPSDFASIPDGDASDFVKASVPGTQEANDAVLLASVPNTTTVNLTETPVQVQYNGQPKFIAVEGTPVQYAVNTANSVFLVDGKYYCCDQGVWFVSAAPTGPWAFSTMVPQSIYQIPPTNPHYNVTYVTVESSTPSTVTYAQTSGYSGEYVASTGVLMFGAGMLIGAALADDDDNYYYYPPYPVHYSYGCGAMYHYGYGGYYAAGHVSYGPYGGAGRAAAYNPVTGTYARSAYAYGPYGSASAVSAYNPYTGARAAGGQVNTAYGSAARAAGYNPTTGNYARAGAASGQYGSAGFAQVGNAYTGRSATVAGATNNQGGSAAAWNTQNSQGKAVKTSSGDVYASNNGTVYKKDSDGNWSSNSGSGWQQAPTQQPRTTSSGQSAPTQAPASTTGQTTRTQPPASGTTTQQRQAAANEAGSRESRSLDSQSQARQRGNAQTDRTREFQTSNRTRPTAGGGGRSGGGGGRGRR